MSRTRKKFPWQWNSCFRCPKGQKNALVNNARKSAIPPDAWDDISYDKQCWLPQRVAESLVKKGWNGYAVIDHLIRKYGLPLRTAREVVEMELICHRGRNPPGTLEVFAERRMVS